MTSRQYHLHNGRKGAAIAIRVTPRSRRNEIVEVQSDGTIRVRLTAPPVEGEANKALVKFLAEVLEVPTSNVEIVAGLSGHDKLVSVLDLDAETVHERILKKIT